jgi:two-component system sensor histidine kinase UhpB
MKNLATIVLFAVLILLGCAVPLFAKNPLPKTELSPGRPSQQIHLTQEEQVWLAAHPDIVLGYTDAFEPEVIVNPDGSYRGILVDILDELNRRLGTNIGLRIDPIPDLLAKARSGETAGILNILPEYGEKLGLLTTKGYLTGYAAVFAPRNTFFDNPSDLAGKKVAIVDGVMFSEKIIERHGKGASVLRVKDALEGLQRVNEGEADIFLGASINAYFLAKYQLFGLTLQYVFQDSPFTGGIAVRSDWPELLSILNKGIASFSRNEIHAIVAKWVTLPKQEKIVTLDGKERAWLAQDHTVQVRAVNIPPYIILRKGTDPVGISIDYLKLIAKRTGVKFKYVVSGKTFPEALDGLITHQGPDLIASLSRTPEREKSILFSKDYARSPYVIFTHTNAKEFISDMSDLLGKKLALPRGTAIHEQVKSKYPELDLRLFDNDAGAIEAVSTQKADAYIGNMTLASFLILEKGLVDLKIAGPSPFGDHVFSLGMRNDWPELGSIIDEALATISPVEQAHIRNKYISIQYEQRETAVIIKWLLGIGGVASGIVFLFVFWNRTLKQQVQERTTQLTATNKSLAAEVEERLQAEERLRYQAKLLENVSDAVISLDNDFKVVSWNTAAERIYGWKVEEALGKVFRELTAAEYQNGSREQVLAKLQQVGFWRGEFIQQKKDGQRVFIQGTVSLIKNKEGSSNGYVGVYRDITEQKDTEEALRQSEERFRATFEQAAVGIAHVAPDGKFLRLNQKFFEIVGYSQKEMQSLSFQNITHPDDLARDLDYVQQLLDGRRNSYSIEKRYVRKDSEIVWVNLTVAAIRMDDGQAGWFVAVIEEISDRKEAEERVKRYQHRLKANALQLTITEEKERRRLAADLHDHVGQSLVFSRIQLAALKEQTSDEEFKELIDEVSQSLLGTIKDTKHLVFELSSPLLHELGLPAATSQWLVEQIREKYGLETEFIDNCKTVLQDNEMKALLFRSIRELLANIIKHAFAKKVGVFFENDENNLVVTVQDDGIGFVFKHASDMSMSREGFGLFSIQERIEDIGGSLNIESEPGKGCKVTLTVPLTI